MPTKYRGKTLDGKHWRYGYYRYIKDTDTHQIQWGDMLEASSDVLPSSVGMFTGLYDKNLKEIYFGDIIMGRAARCIIGWHKRSSCIAYYHTVEEIEQDKPSCSPVYIDDMKFYEIIGNTTDNINILNNIITHK